MKHLLPADHLIDCMLIYYEQYLVLSTQFDQVAAFLIYPKI